MFGDFFIDKIDNIMKEIETVIEYENISSIVDYKAQHDSSKTNFAAFQMLSETELKKLITSLASKSCLLDPIPTHILKDCLDVLISPLLDIVNSSLKEGVFPAGWKCAIVTPLLKRSGLDLVCKNYRPVSNLSFVSKTVEKAGLVQYVNHLESIDMYSKHNSAYKNTIAQKLS